MKLDPILHMQVEISNLYMEKYKLSTDEFIILDKKYGILEFIEEGYEPFHLMGNEGILQEIEDYINIQKVIQ